MQHKFFAKKPQEIFQSRLSSVYTYSLSNIFSVRILIHKEPKTHAP